MQSTQHLPFFSKHTLVWYVCCMYVKLVCCLVAEIPSDSTAKGYPWKVPHWRFLHCSSCKNYGCECALIGSRKNYPC